MVSIKKTPGLYPVPVVPYTQTPVHPNFWSLIQDFAFGLVLCILAKGIQYRTDFFASVRSWPLGPTQLVTAVQY